MREHFCHRRAKAGEIGFEPMNAASKGRCLTAWRLPNEIVNRIIGVENSFRVSLIVIRDLYAYLFEHLLAHRSFSGGGATPQGG